MFIAGWSLSSYIAIYFWQDLPLKSWPGEIKQSKDYLSKITIKDDWLKNRDNLRSEEIYLYINELDLLVPWLLVQFDTLDHI